MFKYFPTNYVWNLSVDLAIEMGARIGEIEAMCAPLLEAARGFQAAAAHLLVAEAASQAAAAFERDGHRRDASGARALVAAAFAKCDAADTPALQAIPVVASPLSARELEVARLASQGLASKDIAQRLYLSPRTIENHLQRVYTKLGVTGRDDLAGHLF